MGKLSHEEIMQKLKNIYKEILPANSRAVLYGSRARGDFNSDSDWDIHVLIPGDEYLSIEEMGKYAHPLDYLGVEIDEFFSVMVYSHSAWAKRSFLPFYKNVEKDKIILHNTMTS